MRSGFSLWLDALRALAALTVLAGHIAHVRFTRGDYYVLREINIASDAVIVFFVLSGCVIAFAAERDGSLGRFAFNRLTRVWSVVLPALIATVMFDAIGYRADPSAYPADYYQPQTLVDMFGRGLSFTNEWQGLGFDRLRLGTNGPLWSLSYEVAFYAIFGIAMFLPRAQQIALIGCLAVFVGLPILALFPAWALGVLVWRTVRDGAPLSLRRAWTWAVGAPVMLVVLKVAGVADALSAQTAAVIAPASHHMLLAYSDEVLWNTVIALFVAVHLIGAARIAEAPAFAIPDPVVRVVRYVAGASFSLYVMHYPTLHLLDATLPETMAGRDFWLLGLTLAVCFAFAHAFERPLKRIRLAALALLRPAARPREAR